MEQFQLEGLKILNKENFELIDLFYISYKYNL